MIDADVIAIAGLVFFALSLILAVGLLLCDYLTKRQK